MGAWGVNGLSARTAGHFTRSGIAKLGFANRDEAAAWGERINQEPYRCRFCQQWHVATRKPSTRTNPKGTT